MTDLHAPDVSSWQGNVDWPRVVATNGGAAIIRSSYGLSADPFFAWRRPAAEAAGVRALGFYHYLTAGSDATAQAQSCARIIGALRPGQFVVCDAEEGSGDQLARVAAFLNTVNGLLRYPGYYGAWLYSGLYFARDHGLSGYWAAPVHTWVASYGSVEPTVGHSLWQHTSSGCIWVNSGIVTRTSGCDCSIFHGTVNDLLARIYQAAPVIPEDDLQPDERAALLDVQQKIAWLIPALSERFGQVDAEIKAVATPDPVAIAAALKASGFKLGVVE